MLQYDLGGNDDTLIICTLKTILNKQMFLIDVGASGGICEKYKEYQEKNKRVWKSLNTGIVTLINYNSPVPPKVSTLTFAHEVGHNFGSPVSNMSLSW